MLETIAGWVTDFISTAGYPGIFLLMLAESALIPIPSEAIMPFSGFLVSTGELNFVAVVIAGTLGNLAGSWLAYWLGHWGDAQVRTLVRRYGKFILLTEHELDASERLFRRFGNAISFFSRVLPGVRTVISLPAGMARVPFVSFTLFTAAGSLIWSALLALIGYELGENWDDIGGVFHKLDLVIVVLLVLLVALYVWYKLRSGSSHSETPTGSSTIAE